MNLLYIFIHINRFIILVALYLSIFLPFSKSQNLINNGSNIIISKGANLIVSNNYTNKSLNTIPGKVNLDGNLIVRGNWINNSPENNVLINIENVPDGNVILDGLNNQFIQGSNYTKFENLIIKKSTKTLDVTDNSVKGILTIDAVLNLNSKKIIIDNPSPSAIKYISKYILSETSPNEGYGEVQWNIADALAHFEIPFGTGLANNDLNLGLTTITKGVPASGHIIFATYPSDCLNNPLPTGVNPTNISPEYIADRYWIINPLYDTKPDIDINFSYTSLDIDNICNPKISPSKLIAQSFCKDCGNDWQIAGSSYPSQNKVDVKGVSGTECYAPWRLMSDEPEATIFFPNAFTPDNSGINDIFKPIGLRLDLFSNYSLLIFDRWGELIFQTNDIFSGWDGTVKNNDVIAPEGVYVWVAKYNNPQGLHKKQTGRVTLLVTVGDK